MRYDFNCPEHGLFEVEQRMSETTRTHACPQCGAESPKHITIAMFNCPRADGDYKLKTVKFNRNT